MRRFLPVLLVPLLAAFAAAAPATKAAVFYYPTTVGSKWVYDDAGKDFVLVVSKVEDRKGTKVVSVEQVEEERNSPYEVVEVSAAGLVKTGCGVALDPPLVLLKAPFKTRDSWTLDCSTGKAALKGTCTVAGEEKIKVPAGTFETVRVDMEGALEFAGLTTKGKMSMWFAPTVGLVKQTAEDRGRDKVLQLKSFTPGKE